MKKIIILSTLLLLMNCENNDANKVDLSYLETLTFLTPGEYIAFFGNREVDTDKTSSCGTASPATSIQTPGAIGSQPVSSTGTSGTTSRFTVLSQIITKNYGESMSIRFVMDTNQIQGSVDSQQGFTMSGGVFNNTVSGRIGTVKWGLFNSGIGYLDESTTGTQTISFYSLELTLSGTFQRNTSTSTTIPNECYTSDYVNCTTVTTATKCFTDDNKTCRSLTTTGSAVTIKGTMNCTAKNIIPGS